MRARRATPGVKVLKVVEIRPMPPIASGKPEWPKSSNQPEMQLGVSRGGSTESWGRRVGQRLGGLRRGAPRRVAPFRSTGPTPISASGTCSSVSSIRSLSAPGALDDRVEVLTVGTASRAKPRSASDERLELLGDGAGGGDQRVDVVEGGAEVDRGGVELAHEVRAAGRPRRRARPRGSRSPPSSRRGLRPAPESPERSASAAVSEAPSTISDSRSALVGVELAEDPARGGEEGVEVVEAAVRLRADAVIGARRIP